MRQFREDVSGPDNDATEPGRDIGPDEARLSSTLQAPDTTGEQSGLLGEDVVEDSLTMNGHTPGRMVPWHISAEILDESTNIPDTCGGFTQHSRPRQMYNGSDYYKSERNRLSTFSDWRYQRTVRKEDLARNGFVYTGAGDRVRCVFCNILLRQWEPSDVVEQEHLRTSADCPLLQGCSVGNVPLQPQPAFPEPMPSCSSHTTPQVAGASSTVTQPPPVNGYHGDDTGKSWPPESARSSSSPVNSTMAVEPSRLATFESWPSQMTQSPEELARTGLYYTGVGDKVKCFHCDVLLYNWEPSDDPVREHARWSPNCPYLELLTEGSTTTESVQKGKGKAMDEDVMQTPAVQALLFDGSYDESAIRRALAVLREKDVGMDKVTAELLLTTIIDMETADALPAAPTSPTQQAPEELRSLRRENESLREKQQCKVCMERDVAVIFYPCKHFVCCAPCSSALSICPICRQDIHSRDRVFMA